MQKISQMASLIVLLVLVTTIYMPQAAQACDVAGACCDASGCCPTGYSCNYDTSGGCTVQVNVPDTDIGDGGPGVIRGQKCFAGLGGACGRAQDCIANAVCAGGNGGGGVNGGGICCYASGTGCSSSGQCCPGYRCGPVSKQCNPCPSLGYSCVSNTDCCGGAVSTGVATFTIFDADLACSNVNGVIGKVCCSPNTKPCRRPATTDGTNTDCCSGATCICASDDASARCTCTSTTSHS